MNLKLYYNSEHCSNFLQLLYSFLYFFVQSFYTELVLAKKLVLDLPCGNTNLSDSEGIINSPNYPFVYPYEISCEWKIYSPEKSVIKLNLVDMDMQEDLFCSEPPCCSNQWLLLPKEQENGSELLLCGNNFISKTMFLSSQVTSIKYFSSGLMINKRGFKITYKIKSRACKINEVECLYSHQCILAEKLCNGIDDCRDGSDEFNCSWKSYSSKHEFLPRKILDVNHHALDICGSGKRPCDLSPDHCYSPMDSCDDEFDCPNGEDEVGCTAECPNQIACSSGGCYYPSQRCNYKRNCRDNSDETGCPPEPCIALQFTCLNGGCVPGSALCDGDDDCGDLSDEENCTKSSFMTAALMGLLSCIFLFCVGISCLYRIYAAKLRASASFAHQLESEAIDDEFIYREPPPAYSVAIGDPGVISYPAPEFIERYFETDLFPQRTRSLRPNRRRHRSGSGLEQTLSSRSCSRPSNGLTVIGSSGISQFPEVQTQPKPINYTKEEPATSRSNSEGVIELLGFQEAVSHSQENVMLGTCHNSSPCSSPSLSPSRESVTSSTSLEDQDLIESYQS